jgi:raffinose/stachyose/melibiose transport system substrate-binding protein
VAAVRRPFTGKLHSPHEDTSMNRLGVLCAAIASLSVSTPGTAAEPVVLKMTLHNPNDFEYYTKGDPIDAAFKKVMPNVTIELEKLKDTEEYENTLKIRSSGNELPDLLPLKPYMIVNFKDYLLPLNDLKATRNNLYAEQYAVGGNVYGIPQQVLNEFVYYRKSVFQELGLRAPTTWPEFLDLLKKVKASGKYTPLALGAKDVWPDYPFNEFMPCLEAGDGALWDTMAKDDAPFAAGKPFPRAYAKIADLFKLKAFGSDPLGVSFEQSRDMFVAKKAAMIAAGTWFMNDYATVGGDASDLGVFFLPVRNTAKDPFYATVMADIFLGVSKSSKHPAEAKAFVDWFFTTYYPRYVKAVKVSSSVKDIPTDDPVLKQAYATVTPKFIVYGGGGVEFTRIKNAVAFDVKRLGQEMLTGASVDEMMADLGKKWKKAQAK